MMRAGTDTGSLMNHIMSRTNGLAPVVGMGATRLGWTDRHAGTVVEVNAKGTELVFQEDIATRTDDNGWSEAQSYSYAPNPEAAKVTYTKRKNGAWVRRGEPMNGGQHLLVGERDEYYDYSF